MQSIEKEEGIKKACIAHLLSLVEDRIDVLIKEVISSNDCKLKHSFNIEIENISGVAFSVKASCPELKKIILDKDETEKEMVESEQQEIEI